MKTTPILTISVSLFVLTTMVTANCYASETNLHLKGKRVLILPVAVDVSGDADQYAFNPQFARVIGMFLERGGMTPELSDESVPVSPEDDLAALEAKVGQHVAQDEPGTDYSLFVTFKNQVTDTGRVLGDSHIVLTDIRGHTVWSKHTTEFPDGPPDCPMSACVFVVKALEAASDLEDFEKGEPGKLSQEMKSQSHVPPENELDAMRARAETFRESGKKSPTLTIFPIHVWGSDSNLAIADEIAGQFSMAKFFDAGTTNYCPELAVEGSPNELRVLWDTATALRVYLRENPVDSEYALFIDMGSPPRIGFVHTFLCTGEGEWVMVDLQNSHQEMYSDVDPVTVRDGATIAYRRIVQELIQPEDTLSPEKK